MEYSKNDKEAVNVLFGKATITENWGSLIELHEQHQFSKMLELFTEIWNLYMK